MDLPWHLYLMACIYILAGINHFRNSKIYIRIIPPFFPNPKLLNALAGIAEIALGIMLCFSHTKVIAAWGIIALLIAVLPANIYMFTNTKAGFGLPRWLLLGRIPMQFLLIAWAFTYTG